MTSDNNESINQGNLLAGLKNDIENLMEASPSDRLTIALFSGDLDKVIAAFIIATGAAAFDMEVDIFVTFWGISAMRDPEKKTKKDFLGKMFGFMLPRGSRKLKLSKMQMGGMGAAMIRGLMKKHNTPSLEELMKTAAETGVKIHICTMSMDLMGFNEDDFIDYPNLDFCGVATFISLASDSKFTLFI